MLKGTGSKKVLLRKPSTTVAPKFLTTNKVGLGVLISCPETTDMMGAMSPKSYFATKSEKGRRRSAGI